MTWKPDIMIYHSPCDDGFGAAWAAYTKWGDSVEFIPGTYGKQPPDLSGKDVLIGDFSFKKPVLDELAKTARSIVILDHHQTAQEDLSSFSVFKSKPERFSILTATTMLKDLQNGSYPPIVALFDMERSGARMVWDFCWPGRDVPLLIKMIEDRDLWRFDLPHTRAISLYLRSLPYDFGRWSEIATALDDDGQLNHILAEAGAVERFYDQKVGEMVATARSETINGVSVPVVNCSWAFASDVAHALLVANSEAPFAACYYDRADGSRSYSLRSEDGRADVSVVAKRYGGGGHRNAAGFEVPQL